MVLNPNNIPSHLRTQLLSLAELVEQFGKTDDGERLRAIGAASPDELARLRLAVLKNSEVLDEWLAGPEADGPDYSEEYLAYSAMRMASDMS